MHDELVPDADDEEERPREVESAGTPVAMVAPPVEHDPHRVEGEVRRSER